ncbi:MAG: hypothetical protein K2G97_02085, partial [Oscillospiraceae bacterium]|nr:hypothetical protein [Oscillospiraceae bacterium]
VLNNEEDGIIENCHIENMRIKDSMLKSGFVLINHGKITGCSTTLSVNSKDVAAGFCAINSGNINSCSSEGNVTAKTNSKKAATICGGFVAENNGTIKESSSIGKVEGQEFAGGFVGINRDKSEIISCKSIGDVESKTWFASINCGGFVGQNEGGILKDCTSEGKVNGRIKNTEAAVGIIVGVAVAVVVICSIVAVLLVKYYNKSHKNKKEVDIDIDKSADEGKIISTNSYLSHDIVVPQGGSGTATIDQGVPKTDDPLGGIDLSTSTNIGNNAGANAGMNDSLLDSNGPHSAASLAENTVRASIDKNLVISLGLLILGGDSAILAGGIVPATKIALRNSVNAG